jgi:hypothetical protein
MKSIASWSLALLLWEERSIDGGLIFFTNPGHVLIASVANICACLWDAIEAAWKSQSMQPFITGNDNLLRYDTVFGIMALDSLIGRRRLARGAECR